MPATTDSQLELGVIEDTPAVIKRRGKPDKILANFKKRSTFKWVLFSTLNVDPIYQRRLQMQKAKRLAHNWNQEKMGVIVISKRANGKYYVIDGQHRYVALTLIDNHPVRIYCEVFEGLTREEEARLFHDLDSQRDNLTTGASFKALIAAKDDAAIEIQKAALRAGLTVDYDRGPSPSNIRAFKTVQDIYRRKGSSGLERILAICAKSWPDSKESAAAPIMLGLEVFLDKYGRDISDKRLIDVLSKHEPSSIVNMGRAINGTLSSTVYPAIAIAIRSLYNRRLTKQRLSVDEIPARNP